MKASPKRFLQFSLLASQKPVCASKTNDPFFIDWSFRMYDVRLRNINDARRREGRPQRYIPSPTSSLMCYTDGLIEAEVFGGIFRPCEDEHLIVEPNLTPVVCRGFNFKVVHRVLARLVAY